MLRQENWEYEQDEFCDNLAPNLEYMRVPRYAPPPSLPDLPPKQSTHTILVGLSQKSQKIQTWSQNLTMRKMIVEVLMGDLHVT